MLLQKSECVIVLSVYVPSYRVCVCLTLCVSDINGPCLCLRYQIQASFGDDEQTRTFPDMCVWNPSSDLVDCIARFSHCKRQSTDNQCRWSQSEEFTRCQQQVASRAWLEP